LTEARCAIDLPFLDTLAEDTVRLQSTVADPGSSCKRRKADMRGNLCIINALTFCPVSDNVETGDSRPNAVIHLAPNLTHLR
jgi:hypothetical protein